MGDIGKICVCRQFDEERKSEINKRVEREREKTKRVRHTLIFFHWFDVEKNDEVKITFKLVFFSKANESDKVLSLKMSGVKITEGSFGVTKNQNEIKK